jgi:hypothetical protein
MSDEVLLSAKTWRKNNASKVAAYNRKWRLANPNKVAAWREANRDKMNAQRRAVWAKNRERGMLKNAQYRSKAHGWAFDLSLSDICIPAFCPALGIPIFRNAPLHSPNAPTLDRMDATKGYTKANVRIISWKANRLKNNATLQELRGLVHYMETQ